jgi:hypothetical protein
MKKFYDLDDHTNRVTFIIFLIFILFIFLTVLYVDSNKPNNKVDTKTSTVVNNEPDWLRIKRRCGIPDSIPWSNHMRLVYGKQIEQTIKSMNYDN